MSRDGRVVGMEGMPTFGRDIESEERLGMAGMAGMDGR